MPQPTIDAGQPSRVGKPAGAPAAAGPPRPGREYLVALAAALALYLLSMAPGPLWQDSGLAQLRVLRGDLYGDLGLALSHPLYYALAIGFQLLPFAESALKTNLVSAVFGALTVANAALFLRLATGRRIGAVVGGLVLAVAHTFWQHCALAEVYTVTTALLTAELLCLLQYARTGKAGWLLALFLANGLGISNHMIAVLSLACYGVALLWLLARGRVRFVTLALAALAWIVGAALYLGLIVGEITGGAGVGATLRSALFGRDFAGSVTGLLPNARMLLNSIMYLGLNFPTPAALLVIAGWYALRELRPRLPGVVLMALLLIHLLWAVRYDVPDQYTFFIPAVVMLALVVGLGAGRFLRSRSRRWRAAVITAALLPVVVYLSLPALARSAKLRIGTGRQLPYRDEYAYFLRPWKVGYRGAARFAQEVHDTLPPGAVVIVARDPTAARPLHYMQLTGRWTRDVRVLPSAAAPRPASEITEQELRSELEARLVYVVSKVEDYCLRWLLDGYELERAGILYRVSAPRPR